MRTAVAKKRPSEKGEDRSNRKTAPIQVEKELARIAATVASHRGITQADLLSPVIRPFLLAQLAIMNAENMRKYNDLKSQNS
jgi:hypothetical protein